MSNEKCPYCNEDKDGYTKTFGMFSLHRDKVNGWQLYGGKGKPRPINYCFMCGRNLRGAAMREILFRGKLIATGEFAYGNLNRTIKGTNIITPDETLIGKYGAVIPETVGQYTGLTDKNSKKIFEGDILEHKVQSDNLVNRGVVNWDSQNARWALQLNTMSPCFYMHNPEAVEIIGNIHDNPELLKGGAKMDGKKTKKPPDAIYTDFMKGCEK